MFGSWNNDRAVVYRELQRHPRRRGARPSTCRRWCSATSATTARPASRSRATRPPASDVFYGEFLVNAQGEDVVAGIRTPQQVSLVGSRRWAALALVPEAERASRYPSLEELMPDIYRQLSEAEARLEKHFLDMQDLEFTIQEGRLWMLQTRNGKRTGAAMVRIAVEMLEEGLIDEKTAVLRVAPEQLDELLHPVFDPQAGRRTRRSPGLPASPGAASGQDRASSPTRPRPGREGAATSILVRPGDLTRRTSAA